MASGFQELEKIPISTADSNDDTPPKKPIVHFNAPESPAIFITARTSDGSNIKWAHIDFWDISLKQKIGRGSYGVVYKALWGDRYVAVKEFDVSEIKSFEREIEQLSMVNHPNIITLYGISRHNLFKYMIMEYAEGGSLHNFLHGNEIPYSMDHALSWASQCADAVAYMHAMKPKPIVHRDLKPPNLLLTNKGRHLKICDFGTVAEVKTIMTNNRGSAAWMAPEVFQTCKYTEKCDVFSWGIVLWEVITREKPFKDFDTSYSISWKIQDGERPSPIPDLQEPIKQLMTSCWDKSPDLRPTMQNVKEQMNILMKEFPGADEPIIFEFSDHQPYLNAYQYRPNAHHLDPIDEENHNFSNRDVSMTPLQINFKKASGEQKDDEELLQISKEKERLMDFYIYMQREEYLKHKSIDSQDTWVQEYSKNE